LPRPLVFFAKTRYDNVYRIEKTIGNSIGFLCQTTRPAANDPMDHLLGTHFMHYPAKRFAAFRHPISPIEEAR
jgi:hypothetical protein